MTDDDLYFKAVSRIELAADLLALQELAGTADLARAAKPNDVELVRKADKDDAEKLNREVIKPKKSEKHVIYAQRLKSRL